MHYFVSCYFNDKKGAQEFFDKYQNVVCLEAYEKAPVIVCEKHFTMKVDGIGFHTNKLVNAFIAKHFDSLESITIIDCDLLLTNHFFKSMTLKLNGYKEPVFIQGFSTSNDLVPGCVCAVNNGMVYNNYLKREGGNVHTGYILAFNRAFLSKIDFHLPEYLVLGGFDWVLMLCIFKRRDELAKLIDNIDITCQLLDFYDAIHGCAIDHVQGHIYHKAHGSKEVRYNGRWEIYKKLTKEVIQKYFLSRNDNL